MSSLQSKTPFDLQVFGIGKRTQRMLAKKKAYNWKIQFHETSIEKSLEDLNDVVYLSPNAEEELTDFDVSFGD